MTAVDIVLLGATGYTGALTADYLGQHLPENVSWAIAGRNGAKLTDAARRIDAAGGRRPDVMVADATDEAALAAVVAQTRVLATTVGPFLEFGKGPVRAAAEGGITYLDITGEAQFVDQTWLELDGVAKATGATLIHAAGFDSVPTDLGVLFTVKAFREKLGEPPRVVRGYLRPRILPTAGTVHTIVGIVDTWRAGTKKARERTNLEGRPVGRKVTGGGRVSRAPGAGIALPLPIIDPDIVLRSARALDAYGPDFRYEHYVVPRGYELAGGAVGAPLLAAAAQSQTARNLLRRVVPSGSGPSERQRAKSSFTIDFHAESNAGALHTRVSGRDPYDGTAAIFGEAAILAARNSLPDVSGQVTTAQAFGQRLIDRIHPDTLTFEVR